MASSFVSYWNYGIKFCGIEYHSTLNDGLNISVITAIKKKGGNRNRQIFSGNRS
jgi:hypothetical protein